jgi:hypothetical protein
MLDILNAKICKSSCPLQSRNPHPAMEFLLLFLSLATFGGVSSYQRPSGNGASTTSGSVLVSGEVGGGNYSYFRMHNESPGRLVLKST